MSAPNAEPDNHHTTSMANRHRQRFVNADIEPTSSTIRLLFQDGSDFEFEFNPRNPDYRTVGSRVSLSKQFEEDVRDIIWRGAGIVVLFKDDSRWDLDLSPLIGPNP